METKTQHLAITSVPVQKWSEHLYDYDLALKVGTIFPELNLPFFAADGRNEKEIPTASDRSDGPSRNEREAFLLKIHEVSFALDDLVLFLDTHPDDQEAAALRKQLIEERKCLLKEYDQHYYSLTKDCEGLWTEGPMPWEGACI